MPPDSRTARFNGAELTRGERRVEDGVAELGRLVAQHRLHLELVASVGPQ